MLKALIFDDEYIVLEGLQRMIDWTQFGIEIAGTASDGLSALELFRQTQPDLILTDIRMPGMDGLQLIEQVLKEAPSTYCIVFSGFNEFEYVKRAIELGVSDYLEKPITIDAIENAIRKMAERLQKIRDMQSLGQKWVKNRQDLLEKAAMDLLLMGGEAALPKWEGTFGEEAAKNKGVTILVSWDKGVYSLPLHAAIQQVHIQIEELFVLVVYYKETPTSDLWAFIESELDSAARTIGAGMTRQLTDAKLSFVEAKRALKVGEYLGQKGIVRYEELGDLATAATGMSEYEEGILLSIRSGSQASLLEQVERTIAWLQCCKLEPEVAEREVLRVFYLIVEGFRQAGSDKLLAEMENAHLLPHVEVREAAAKGRLFDWFRDSAKQLSNWAIERMEPSRHAAVEQALLYIEKNGGRDLSLQEVADHVGMNATYLSVLFKDVVGQSYIKYLTRLRMEKAKTLLARGMKVNEVSEKTGYVNYRHFSDVFKKYTGVSPGQYKEQSPDPKN
ncbi:response regulator transcription factor [Paenibacillus xanthanilyticus]|uniref:Response regulator n=1 Tax=Paenibacillus xanthanilyticus TaxID=1783531 RepID=A0ABV8K9A6_9BACL